MLTRLDTGLILIPMVSAMAREIADHERIQSRSFCATVRAW